MRKKSITTREVKKNSSKKPAIPQQDKFKRRISFDFVLPQPFLLLCRLMDVQPSRFLTDFMEDLGHVSWNKEGREKSRELLTEYFLERGYGSKYFNQDDIKRIFREMDAINLLYPEDAEDEFLQQHLEWRDKYEEYWFHKWYSRLNRTL